MGACRACADHSLAFCAGWLTNIPADIQESMLSRETLARMLLLQMHQTKHPDAKSEDALED